MNLTLSPLHFVFFFPSSSFKPSILLLDEPTSGLDATAALKLVYTLRTLAQGGRTIITTIHQPSARMFLQLDKLLLLSEGRTIYAGPGSLAASYFAQIGYPLPFGVNVADFLLDLASGDIGENTQQGGEPGGAGVGEPRDLGGDDDDDDNDGKEDERGGHGQEKIRSSTIPIPISNAGETSSFVVAWRSYLAGVPGRGKGKGDLFATVDGTELTRRYLHGYLEEEEEEEEEEEDGKEASSSSSISGSRSAALRRPPPPPTESSENPTRITTTTTMMNEKEKEKKKIPRTPFWVQFGLLFSRFVRLRRFEALGLQRAAQICVVGGLSGLFWWQRGTQIGDVVAIMDTSGLLFFEMLFMAFASLFAALFTFPQEFRMMLKERASGMYRLSAFYAARVCADLPLDALYPTIFVVLVYTLGGLRADVGAFFANWAAILLIILTAQSYGLLLGAIFMNPKTAQTLATILMLSFMLTGGFYVSTIPVWISWLKYLGFIYYGWNILLYIEYKNRAGIVDWPANLPRIDDINVGLDVGVLLAMLVLLRVAIYYVLQFKTTVKAKGN